MTNKANLTAAELSDRWGGQPSTQTLANWRSQKKGPGYVKIGRKVVYPLSQVEKFEADNLKTANDNQA